MSSPDSSQRAATGNTESSHSEAVGVLASPVEANSKKRKGDFDHNSERFPRERGEEFEKQNLISCLHYQVYLFSNEVSRLVEKNRSLQEENCSLRVTLKESTNGLNNIKANSIPRDEYHDVIVVILSSIEAVNSLAKALKSHADMFLRERKRENQNQILDDTMCALFDEAEGLSAALCSLAERNCSLEKENGFLSDHITLEESTNDLNDIEAIFIPQNEYDRLISLANYLSDMAYSSTTVLNSYTKIWESYLHYKNTIVRSHWDTLKEIFFK